MTKEEEKELNRRKIFEDAAAGYLRKVKDAERRAFTKLFTYPISWLCNVSFVVLVILKVTDNIDWSLWMVASPMWGGFLANFFIDIIIRIVYIFKK